MSKRNIILSAALVAGAIFGVMQAPAQAPAGAKEKGKGGAKATRPPLFFKEEWKQIQGGGENAAAQGHVANPNLELKLYGTEGEGIQVTGAANDENNPVHAWTGVCEGPCGLALRDKNNFADLTGLARIRWVTKMSGFHQIHPIVKLADGTWLVGDHADGSPTDWLENEFNVADVKWLKLDIKRVVTTGTWIEKPDLSKVDEIGFVDLYPGSGHGPGGWSDVGRIEVFAKPIAR
jgi:hypothetical protein